MNYAIDRPALLRVGGLLAGKRTDQILPPSMRGFRDAKLYPIKGCGRGEGEVAGAGSNARRSRFCTRRPRTSVARGQIFKFNLEQMGFNLTLKPQPFAVAIKTAGDKGGDFDAFWIGWLADYPDPFDFINVLLDGTNIQESNNSNYAYLNNAAYNKRMQDAAEAERRRPLRGVRRASTST